VTAPAGWYPDPDGSGGRRYFDGQTWTEHRAAAVEAPRLEATAAAPRTPGPNAKVIAGVIAAVVVLVVVGVAAVVLTRKADVGDTTVTTSGSATGRRGTDTGEPGRQRGPAGT
jgi:Protein of unknown function (DUF2510)